MKLKESYLTLMDDMFERIVDSNCRRLNNFNPSPALYYKQMNIDIALAEYLFNSILQYANENDLLIAEKGSSGKYAIVRMNDFQCYEFIKSGGFRILNYQEHKIESKYSTTTKVTINGSDNIIAVGDHNTIKS
ncbi:hypothetical protein [Pedobacter miscanthi]|uniref:Uncharacterized protein n=1 Tax=Pedobacter miscanthi TaxID=2259170 RepID=A0A366KMX0_9SPHI|nr:hypothetical protein [Pedobacter miscanthi]RBQ02870.1 hypothetical protein DRW42_24795 [Pedobacter miscanthi]